MQDENRRSRFWLFWGMQRPRRRSNGEFHALTLADAVNARGHAASLRSSRRQWWAHTLTMSRSRMPGGAARWLRRPSDDKARDGQGRRGKQAGKG